MMNNGAIKKKDFIEIKFSGYANGNLFDSNKEEDIKKIHPEAKVEPMNVIVGEGMVIPGLDREFEGKEIGKEYEVKISAKDGFGERKRELVKTIPEHIFNEKKIQPYPGLVVSMDGLIAKVITVSGARVMTDFNNPLAGKEILYKFSIARKIEDEKEKCDILFFSILKFIPEFEIKEEIVIKGIKAFEVFAATFKDKFKELIGKNLRFELKDEKKEKEQT